MKIIYEAKVTSVMQHEPDKDGLPNYSSGVEYGEKYNSKTIYVRQRLELGQPVWIIITDQDPALAEVAAIEDIIGPPDEIGEEPCARQGYGQNANSL